MNTNDITAWLTGHEVPVAGGAALVVLALAVWLVKAVRGASRERFISALINTAALLATSVQASGMWKFFGAVMGLPVGFRIVLFGFMEIALLACGLRARANVEEGGDAGIDGILVWVLALASGLMSSTDASSAREALMRILVAVVVALLWTRDLMAAKKTARAVELAAGGKKRTGPVRWRITPERIAVWLRLADAVDTDVAAIEAARKVIKVLRRSDRERDGFRWPFTPAARAYRARMSLFADGLRHGDPSAVHELLSGTAYADALTRMGISASQTQPALPGGESGESGESEASQTRELLTPADPVFAQTVASLSPVTHPALTRRVTTAASAPARKAASVTARVGTDRDSVAATWRDSVAAGAPLSTYQLAEVTGVSQSTARRVVAAVRNQTEEVA